VIMATNPTVEGDGTALYITNLLAPFQVEVTRLPRGITTGSILEPWLARVPAGLFRGSEGNCRSQMDRPAIQAFTGRGRRASGPRARGCDPQGERRQDRSTGVRKPGSFRKTSLKVALPATLRSAAKRQRQRGPQGFCG
jgi:hypothetical protein